MDLAAGRSLGLWGMLEMAASTCSRCWSGALPFVGRVLGLGQAVGSPGGTAKAMGREGDFVRHQHSRVRGCRAMGWGRGRLCT